MNDRKLSEIIEAASSGKKASSNPHQYEAISQRLDHDRELRLWIRTSKGTSHHIQYAQIIDMVVLPPNRLSIICANCAFSVTCQNIDLGALEELLHDEKVYKLQPFNAKFFDAPDEGTGIFTEIKLLESRPTMVKDNPDKKSPPDLVVVETSV